MKRIAIVGAGAGGTMMAAKLRRVLPPTQWEIAVFDRDETHVYQPGLLLLPFGGYRPHELVRPRKTLLPDGVSLSLQPIERIDVEAKRIRLRSGDAVRYDLLIIATGCEIAPEQTEGLTGAGWGESAIDFYTLEGSTKLAARLAHFAGGRLVINVVDMPIKCPVAPLEFAFLADAFFRQRGIRDKVEIVYATPLDGAFTKPVASRLLSQMMSDRQIRVETNFAAGRVDGEKRVLHAYDGREQDYDLLVTVPLHNGSQLIRDSELGDDFGFVPTDKHTLQAKAHTDVFVLGDATDLPASKAGSVAHFQSEVLLGNVLRHLDGRALEPAFDGHSNCFIETGDNKAMLIDFNYETEPLPGKFPLPGIGPFTLLGETHINHWGKLGFKWVYWNLLLRGEELPLDHRMLMAGKAA